MKNLIKKFFSNFKFICKKNKFQLISKVILIIAISAIIGIIVQASFKEFYKGYGNNEKLFNFINIAIALIAFSIAIITLWKNSINQRVIEIIHKQTEIQNNTRFDELFSSSVNLLDETEDLPKHKGGVYLLKDIAISSPKHTQKCIDMLCSINESWMPFILEDNPKFFESNNDFVKIKSFNDIYIRKLPDGFSKEKLLKRIFLTRSALQALSQIMKYVSGNNNFKDVYDLSNKFLCCINLTEFNNNGKFIFCNSNLQGADLSRAILKSSNLKNVNLESACIMLTDLESANLEDANLKSVFVFCGVFESANLCNANLYSAALSGAYFKYANLKYARLESVNSMVADFSFADLELANLECAKFENVNFQSANLVGANFRSAKLILANFQSANLERADFRYADLKDANFTDAKLNRTDFRNAKNINKAIFKNANIENAIFSEDAYDYYYPNKPRE